MLPTEAPFPYAGSYCLVEHEGRDQLARIINRAWFNGGARALISLPLRPDAGGNRWVAESELIHATGLSAEEAREFHDLDRLIFARSISWRRKHKAELARRDALKRRMIVAPLMRQLLRSLRVQEARRRAA
jgi:hypothetical protein